MKKLSRIIISIFLLFIFSCDDDENPVSSTNEIDVDWFLLKVPELNLYQYLGINLSYDGFGYFFYYTNTSNITDCTIQGDGLTFIEGSEGILSFNYNGESFSFDLNDSSIGVNNWYGIYTEGPDEFDRIIYHEDVNYFTLFDENNFGYGLNGSSPNEVIDYR